MGVDRSAVRNVKGGYLFQFPGICPQDSFGDEKRRSADVQQGDFYDLLFRFLFSPVYGWQMEDGSFRSYLPNQTGDRIPQMSQQELTWPKAIMKVLSASTTPMHYREITDRIIAQSLRSSLGATPAATVNAQLANSIKHQGGASPYIRVAKGVFALRSAVPYNISTPPKLTPDVNESEETEEQYEIVTSFGMFWRRSAVEWIATSELWGMQEIGSTPVDFFKQLGIYLLYDGREVIYVGRSTDRPLGRRLYEHTLDRLATRWDRFSWFGLLPVSEAGELQALPESYEAPKLIPALEALLVEALEPRQNRKRGDDLAAVEYIQRLDPEIEKKHIKATLDAVYNKL
jgi:hypothetical protein